MKYFNILITALLASLLCAGSAMAAAETLTSTRAASGFPVHGYGMSGNLKVAHGTYEVAANVEDGDIFEMCKLPAGATVVGGYLLADDLDTGTEALDLDLGWAANGAESADPDGLGNFGTLTGDAFAGGNLSGVVGLIYPVAGTFIDGDLPTFTKTTTIQVEANTAAGTFTAGAMSVVIYYTMD